MRLGSEARIARARLLPRARRPTTRRGSRAGDPRGAPGRARSEIARATRSGGRPREGLGRATGDRRIPTCVDLLALADDLVRQGRLDHRRRRLGLRHRLRRPRPRPRFRQQREHPGARHRGVLQHRRTGVQGHAPRRGGQVRGFGQGHRQEGPGRAGAWPTATSTSPRSPWAPTTCRRSRRSSRPTPGPARRSSSPTPPASPTASTCRKSMEPPEGRGAIGYWPLYRFQPTPDRRAASPSSWTRGSPRSPVREFGSPRPASPSSSTDPSRSVRAPRGAAPGRRRRALALLQQLAAMERTVPCRSARAGGRSDAGGYRSDEEDDR